MEFDTIWVVSWDVLRPTAPWAMLLLLLLLRAAAALPHFLVPAEPGRRHVYVGVGSTPSDLAWMQRQEVHLEVRYRPLLVQPRAGGHRGGARRRLLSQRGLDPRWDEDEAGNRHLRALEKEQFRGSLRLNVASQPIYKTGLDSLFHVRGRHDTPGRSFSIG